MLNICKKCDEITEITQSALQQPDSFELIFMPDKTTVHLGLDENCNKSFCEEHDIFILNLPRHGGAIVSCVGDIAYFSVGQGVYEANKGIDFLLNFSQYLQSKGLNAQFKENDVLIDGYKVASYGNGPIELNNTRYYTTGIQVSMNVDINLIQAICTKPMDKIPKSLSDFGVTQEEVFNLMKDFFERRKQTYLE